MIFLNSKILDKVAKVILWIFLLCLLVVGCSQFYDSGHKTLHPKEARQESIKIKEQRKKANAALMKQLNTDQHLASSNNEPVSYGLNYANYIDSIKYTEGENVTIYVTSNFQNLDASSKTSVINGAQDMAKTTLWHEKVISQSEMNENVFATVNLGANSIGQSSISNHSEIKWSE